MGVVGPNARRGAVALILLLFLVGTFVGFGHLGDDPDDPYPSTRVQVTQYEEFVGDTGTITGPVTETNPVTIRVDYEGGHQEFEVTGDIPAVETGDRLSVYGEYRPDYNIYAEKAIRQSMGNRVYMYVISGLTLVGIVAFGLRYWSVHWRTLTVAPWEN